jgi:hypothetical protein
LFIIVSLLFTGCNKNNTVQPPNQDNSNYFPNTNNTYYKYSINLTDSTGTLTTGSKSTTYNGTQVFGSTTYQKQTDTLFVASLVTGTNLSYFRKDASGVFYFLDTTGLYRFIPAAYTQYLLPSAELKVMSTPLSDGLNWQAFKLGLTLLNYNIIDVEASYMGKENVVLNLTSGQVTVSAAKIKYIMTLKIPNLNNVFATPYTSTFNATGWFAADIGPVKWEGNGAVLNGFSGGGINLGDTTSTVSQVLTYYNIK